MNDRLFRLLGLMFGYLAWLLFIILLVGRFSSLVIGGALVSSASVLFVIFIRAKIPRFHKGMSIILVGLTITVFYNFLVRGDVACLLESIRSPACEFKFADENDWVWVNTIDMMVQLLVIACGGAGGSLIAAYADTFASDQDRSPVYEDSGSKMELIRLQKQMRSLGRKVSVIIVLLGALLLLFFVCQVIL